MELMGTCAEKLKKRIQGPIPECILGKMTVAVSFYCVSFPLSFPMLCSCRLNEALRGSGELCVFVAVWGIRWAVKITDVTLELMSTCNVSQQNLKNKLRISSVPHSADSKGSAVLEGEAWRHPPRREALKHPVGR